MALFPVVTANKRTCYRTHVKRSFIRANKQISAPDITQKGEVALSGYSGAAPS